MPQLTYHGSVAGERTEVASSTMPARRIASGPPSRAAHHWRTAIHSSRAAPIPRKMLMNSCCDPPKSEANHPTI